VADGLAKLADDSAPRLATVGLAGIVLGGISAGFAPWQVSTLAGWDAAGLLLIAMVWLRIGRFDADRTRTHATREDSSRVAAQLLLVAASVASLAGVAAALVKANQTDGAGRVGLTAIAMLTVAVSWAVVHTVFALRYAHDFYTPPLGGIDFKNDDERPDYQDFAYVAFTVGMTFQVSDTDIQDRSIRRAVLRQALLAYLFGAVILAVTVNVIAGAIG